MRRCRTLPKESVKWVLKSKATKQLEAFDAFVRSASTNKEKA